MCLSCFDWSVPKTPGPRGPPEGSRVFQACPVSPALEYPRQRSRVGSPLVDSVPFTPSFMQLTEDFLTGKKPGKVKVQGRGIKQPPAKIRISGQVVSDTLPRCQLPALKHLTSINPPKKPE